MDCAPFIRTKLVLATWVAIPLLLLISMGLAIRGFYYQQQVSYEKKKAISKMIPLMQVEADYASGFLKTHRVDRAGNGSAQELYIGLLNNAGATSGFIIETIDLDEEVLDEELGTAQIVIRLQGAGTCRQIAEFLSQVKQKDPLICEQELRITPGGRSQENLRVEAAFTKIYVN